MKSHKKEKGDLKQKRVQSKQDAKQIKKDDEDPLKKAIFALGGDEQDYALVQDVSDVENQANTDDVRFHKMQFTFKVIHSVNIFSPN